MTKPLTRFMERIRSHVSGLARWGDARVTEEQLRMIWAHSRLALPVAMAFAISLALAVRNSAAPAALVDTWLAIKLAISLYRTVQGWRFLQRPLTGTQCADATLLTLVADAAVWGAGGLYVALTAPMPMVSFVSAVLACITCVATFGLQVSARFTAGYAVPIMAPTAVGLMLRGDVLSELGGAGLLLLLGLQLSTATRSERRLAEGIRLRWRAEALAQDKADALKAVMRQSAVKTQFLANISHELRTPLHGILGMAQLLHRDVRAPALARRVELIESSGQHLLGLINDLLDISRIEAGQFVIRSEAFDLAAQVEQLVGIYTLRAEDKGLRLDTRSNLPTPCWVMGDPARFRQVLHNLLGNAMKFTRQGSISLSLTHDALSGTVRATVQDTGIGIPREALGRIFEPFQQVDSDKAPSSPSEGAGLGLAIARDIARAMGGDIVAESELGQGTVMIFTARLPSATSASPHADQANAAPAANEPTAHCAPASLSAARTRDCLVLLAEDNDINALVATNFLEIIGADMERVTDGQEAVRAALRTHRRPDLILMDCHMPRMDGYEATRTIRTQERLLGLPRLPIVALTATASDAERLDCTTAGMDDYLSKPCTLEALSQMLEQWTVARRASPRPDAPWAQQAGSPAHDESPVDPDARCRA